MLLFTFREFLHFVLTHPVLSFVGFTIGVIVIKTTRIWGYSHSEVDGEYKSEKEAYVKTMKKTSGIYDNVEHYETGDKDVPFTIIGRQDTDASGDWTEYTAVK